MSFLKNPIIKFAINILALIGLFLINIHLGLGVVTAYIIFKLYTNRAGIMSFIGRFYYARDNIQMTLAWYERAYRTGAASANNVISYGYLLLKSGNIEKAEKVFNSVWNMKLSNDEKMLVRSNTALVLWKKGQLDEAIALLKEVFSNFKTTAIYGSLGYLLILKGDLQEALEFNREAYEYNDQNPVIADNLGQNYYLLGEYDKAAEIYEKVMEKKPDFPEPYYNYGLVLKAQGNQEKALEMMKKALDYNFTFLSTVKKEDVESAIANISGNA